MNEDTSLQCPSCQKTYVLKTREPYLLPCLHSVCRHCLTGQVEQQVIQCSICNTQATTTGGCHTDHVTRNELMTHISKNNPERFPCTNKLDGQPSKIFCFECNHFFCENCTNYHSQLESTKNHASVPTGKLSSVPFPEWQSKQKCQAHPDYPVVFYCKDATCMKLVCLFCLSKDHKGHDTEEIEDVYDAEKARLGQISKLLQERILALKKMEVHQQKVKLQRQRIRETFQKIRTTVKNRHQSQRQILEYIDREYRAKFEDTMNILQQRLKKLEVYYNNSITFYDSSEYKSIESTSVEMPEPNASEVELVFVQIGLVNLLEDVRSYGTVKSTLAESK